MRLALGLSLFYSELKHDLHCSFYLNLYHFRVVKSNQLNSSVFVTARRYKFQPVSHCVDWPRLQKIWLNYSCLFVDEPISLDPAVSGEVKCLLFPLATFR
jgi:hypothetical protein